MFVYLYMYKIRNRMISYLHYKTQQPFVLYSINVMIYLKRRRKHTYYKTDVDHFGD